MTSQDQDRAIAFAARHDCFAYRTVGGVVLRIDWTYNETRRGKRTFDNVTGSYIGDDSGDVYLTGYDDVVCRTAGEVRAALGY